MLELGPATGYLSQFLKESLGCTVDAIELSKDMAEHARPWCRRIIVGDVEFLDLADVLEGETYNIIVCADVIEHLRDPWALTQRLAPMLAEGGSLLLSLPNIGYLGLLVDLLRGNFDYRDEGLLDRSHLHFFTINSLRQLLEDAGWHIWTAEQVTLSLSDSEFRVRLETLTPALRDELMMRPDALCYQWVVEARRNPPALPFELHYRPPEDRFQVRLFWRGEETGFDYSRDQLVWARLGVMHQVLEFEIPAGQQSLALSLTDRIGFIGLHAIDLFAMDGCPLWHWRSDMPPPSTGDSVGVEFGGRSALWFVRDTESRLVLSVSPLTVAVARRLRVEMDAPVSADFLDAMAYWQGPNGLPARLAACEASRRRLARRNAGDESSASVSSRPAILHVLPACGGGVERFVRELSYATAKHWRHFAIRVTEASWVLEEMDSASYWPLSETRKSDVVEALAVLQPVCIHAHATGNAVISAANAIASRYDTCLGITLHDVLFADAAAFSDSAWNGQNVLPDPAQKEFLQSARFVTAPSHFIAELARKNYGIEVAEIANGIELAHPTSWEDTVEVDIGGQQWSRRIAVLGALGSHKGGERLFDIADSLPSDIVMVVIGFLDGQLETGWASEHHRSLADRPGAERVFVTGPYASCDLSALFEYYRPQLVLFPGNVPESFSYTLSEVWSHGAIPVVPLHGALGERTSEVTAVRFDVYTSLPALAVLLDDWSSVAAAKRRESLRRSIRSIIHQLVPTLADMANAFNDLYKNLSNTAPAVCDVQILDMFSTLCEMNLDPAQFRAELRLMMEQNQVLRATDLERQRWNERLEASISELKARNLVVEKQLADLAEEAETNRIRHEQEVASLRERVNAASAILGDGELDWTRNGRVVRLAKRIPGFIRALDILAAQRKR